MNTSMRGHITRGVVRAAVEVPRTAGRARVGTAGETVPVTDPIA